MKSSPGATFPTSFPSRPPAAGRGRARAVLLRAGILAWTVGLLVAGCRSTSSTPADPTPDRASVREVRPVDTAPAWIAEPLSWEKLATIETWLATDGARARPLWRIEGELVLHLGRLEFARRDAGKNAVDANALATRVRGAREGLEHVMSDIDATPAQRRRAQEGIARSGKLLNAGMPRPMPNAKDGLVTRAMWGATRPRVDRMDKTDGAYTRITVHHSADPDPVPLDGSAARTYQAVREIQKAHMDGKTTHYGDIGYHFLIDPYGRLIEGRDLSFQGAHAYGDNNVQNIGICVIGNFEKDKPTAAALAALEKEIEYLRTRYKIPRSRVFGHRELRSTECPGENLMKWVEAYRKRR